MYELTPKERVNLTSKRLLNLEKLERDYPHGQTHIAIRHAELALQQAIADQRREWAQAS